MNRQDAIQRQALKALSYEARSVLRRLVGVENAWFGGRRSGVLRIAMWLAVGLLILVSASSVLGQGSIVGWGSQVVVDPAKLENLIAIAAGGYHSLGLKSDGSIVAWGWNKSGQCNVPEPNSGFVAIAAGGYHSLGLKSDGRIVAWGRNYNGQCNVPAPNSGFVAIAAGEYHSLGLKSDGRIVAWGYNYYGQCNVPEPNSGFVAIAGGSLHSLGLKGYVTPNVPVAPSHLVATVNGPRAVLLTWRDNSLNETCFEVWRKEGKQGTFILVQVLGANTESWTDTTIHIGINYFYRVRACNTNGCSINSNEVFVRSDWQEDFSSLEPLFYFVSGNGSWDQGGHFFRLTPGADYKRGRLFSLCRRNMDCWLADFDLLIRPILGITPADGLTFAFCRDYAYPASYGGDLDFSGADGYAIEFDTWRNDTDPTDGNHIGLIKDSARNHLAYAVVPPLADNQWHHVSIRFCQGRVEVWLDNVKYLDYVIPNYSSLTGFFGFTAATGQDGYAEHIIDNICILPVSPESLLCDLSVDPTEIRINPLSPWVGEPTNIEFVVRNGGFYAGAATAVVYEGHLPDTSVIAVVPSVSVEPSGAETLSVTWAPSELREHNITIQLLNFSPIDSDSTNDMASVPVGVGLTGSLSGSIALADSEIPDGVLCTLADPVTLEQRYECYTDSSGHYSFDRVSARSYVAFFMKGGYATACRTVTVMPSQSSEVSPQTLELVPPDAYFEISPPPGQTSVANGEDIYLEGYIPGAVGREAAFLEEYDSHGRSLRPEYLSGARLSYVSIQNGVISGTIGIGGLAREVASIRLNLVYRDIHGQFGTARSNAISVRQPQGGYSTLSGTALYARDRNYTSPELWGEHYPPNGYNGDIVIEVVDLSSGQPKVVRKSSTDPYGRFTITGLGNYERCMVVAKCEGFIRAESDPFSLSLGQEFSVPDTLVLFPMFIEWPRMAFRRVDGSGSWVSRGVDVEIFCQSTLHERAAGNLTISSAAIAELNQSFGCKNLSLSGRAVTITGRETVGSIPLGVRSIHATFFVLASNGDGFKIDSDPLGVAYGTVYGETYVEGRSDRSGIEVCLVRVVPFLGDVQVGSVKTKSTGAYRFEVVPEDDYKLVARATCASTLVGQVFHLHGSEEHVETIALEPLVSGYDFDLAGTRPFVASGCTLSASGEIVLNPDVDLPLSGGDTVIEQLWHGFGLAPAPFGAPGIRYNVAPGSGTATIGGQVVIGVIDSRTYALRARMRVWDSQRISYCDLYSNEIPVGVGNIEGTVLLADQQSSPMAHGGITVEVVGNYTRTATTDKWGHFVVSNLPVGEYTVCARKLNYIKKCIGTVVVSNGVITVVPTFTIDPLVRNLQFLVRRIPTAEDPTGFVGTADSIEVIYGSGFDCNEALNCSQAKLEKLDSSGRVIGTVEFTKFVGLCPVSYSGISPDVHGEITGKLKCGQITSDADSVRVTLYLSDIAGNQGVISSNALPVGFGSISGRCLIGEHVDDNSGIKLSILTHAYNKALLSWVSGVDGAYSFTKVPKGDYYLILWKSGFKYFDSRVEHAECKIDTVRISHGQSTVVCDLILDPLLVTNNLQILPLEGTAVDNGDTIVISGEIEVTTIDFSITKAYFVQMNQYSQIVRKDVIKLSKVGVGPIQPRGSLWCIGFAGFIVPGTPGVPELGWNTYLVRLDLEGNDNHGSQCIIRSNELPVDANVRVTGGWIAGVVYQQNEMGIYEPAVGARVSLIEKGKVISNATISDSGFIFTRLRSGVYDVRASSSDGRINDYRNEIVISAADSTEFLRFHLRRRDSSLTLSFGRLLDRSGTPIDSLSTVNRHGILHKYIMVTDLRTNQGYQFYDENTSRAAIRISGDPEIRYIQILPFYGDGGTLASGLVDLALDTDHLGLNDREEATISLVSLVLDGILVAAQEELGDQFTYRVQISTSPYDLHLSTNSFLGVEGGAFGATAGAQYGTALCWNTGNDRGVRKTTMEMLRWITDEHGIEGPTAGIDLGLGVTASLTPCRTERSFGSLMSLAMPLGALESIPGAVMFLQILSQPVALYPPAIPPGVEHLAIWAILHTLRLNAGLYNLFLSANSSFGLPLRDTVIAPAISTDATGIGAGFVLSGRSDCNPDVEVGFALSAIGLAGLNATFGFEIPFAPAVEYENTYMLNAYLPRSLELPRLGLCVTLSHRGSDPPFQLLPGFRIPESRLSEVSVEFLYKPSTEPGGTVVLEAVRLWFKSAQNEMKQCYWLSGQDFGAIIRNPNFSLPILSRLYEISNVSLDPSEAMLATRDGLYDEFCTLSRAINEMNFENPIPYRVDFSDWEALPTVTFGLGASALMGRLSICEKYGAQIKVGVTEEREVGTMWDRLALVLREGRVSGLTEKLRNDAINPVQSWLDGLWGNMAGGFLDYLRSLVDMFRALILRDNTVPVVLSSPSGFATITVQPYTFSQDTEVLISEVSDSLMGAGFLKEYGAFNVAGMSGQAMLSKTLSLFGTTEPQNPFILRLRFDKELLRGVEEPVIGVFHMSPTGGWEWFGGAVDDTDTTVSVASKEYGGYVVGQYTQSGKMPPAAVRAGSGYSNCVPLRWEAPDTTAQVAYYNILSADSADGPYCILAHGVTDEHYVDTTAVNGAERWYVVYCMYDDGIQSNLSEPVAAMPGPIEVSTVIPSRELKMLSIPVETVTSSVDSLFQDDLGARSGDIRWFVKSGFPPIWRTVDSVSCGSAYWIKIRDNTVDSLLIDVMGSFGEYVDQLPVALGTGWNQIGLLSSLPCKWDDHVKVVTFNGFARDTINLIDAVLGCTLGSALYEYVSASRDYVWHSVFDGEGVLQPWGGYLVYCFADSAVLLFPGQWGGEVGMGHYNEGLNMTTGSEDSWTLQMSLTHRNFIDAWNFIGISRNADPGYDGFDIIEPPRIERSGKLYFQAPIPFDTSSINLCRDIRPSLTSQSDSVVWILCIDSPSLTADEESYEDEFGLTIGSIESGADGMTLSWDSASIPEGVALYMCGIPGEPGCLDMRVRNSVEIAAQVNPNTDRLTIVMKKANQGTSLPSAGMVDANNEGEVTGIQGIKPNPFTGTVMIECSIGSKSDYSVDIYDVTGRKIATIGTGQNEVGIRRFTWDGTTAGGVKASPGIYFCRLVVANECHVRKLVLLE